MSHRISYDPVSMRWALSDGSHYLELPEWAYEILVDEHERETKQLKSENAKLRELVCEMSKYLHCPTNGITEGCPPCPLYDREEDECKIDLCKRKLGIGE